MELQILLCPISSIELLPAEIKLQYLDQYEQRELDVCKYPPRTRDQFIEWGELWPIVYRPTESDRIREEGISISEQSVMEEFMRAVMEDDVEMKRLTGNDELGAVLVNHHNKKVKDGIL
jgi:hypothetical protein